MLQNIFRRAWSDRRILSLFFCLSIVIVSLIALHLLYEFANVVPGYEGIFRSYKLSLTADRGVAEFFNYFVIAYLTYTLMRIYLKTHQIVYLIFSAVYFLVLLDDSLSLHETLGLLVSGGENIGTNSGLRAQDYGELAVFGFGGIIVLAVVIYSIRKSDRRHLRIGGLLLACLGVLVFFGVVVDFFGRLTNDPVLIVLFSILEDGGEMIVIAGTCVLAQTIYRYDDLYQGSVDQPGDH